MDYNDIRINKLRLYLIGIINELADDSNFQINADMLYKDPNNYSLDKIPSAPVVEEWVIGGGVKQDLYSFRSRMEYSQDTINNLLNIGFFEKFEEKIKSNNESGILPDIDNIESIECLNTGTLNNATTNTAEFDIQIKISYREE